MYPQQDQHFMKDENLLKRIAGKVRLCKDDVVLEIGGGDGALTRILAEKCRVISVEIDPDMCEKLHGISNVEVVCGNALEYLDRHRSFEKIISNIPYSISEPLFAKLLTMELKAGVFVVSSGFYNVLKSDSKLGILAKSFFTIKLEEEIPKEAFEPVPRVDSVLMKITPKKRLSKKDRIIQSLVKQQDKKIKNALLKHYEGAKTKNEVRKMLEGLDEKILEKGILELSGEETERLAGFKFD